MSSLIPVGIVEYCQSFEASIAWVNLILGGGAYALL